MQALLQSRWWDSSPPVSATPRPQSFFAATTSIGPTCPCLVGPGHSQLLPVVDVPNRDNLLAAPACLAQVPLPDREPTSRSPYHIGRLRGAAFRRLYRRLASRRREEVEAERRRLRDDTEGEIAALLAEHHAALPRWRASAIGAVYARYSSEFQHSIADQVRACLEEAARLGIHVPCELVFFDLAVRGCKERRPGLDGLSSALARPVVPKGPRPKGRAPGSDGNAT
jgi:Resolvase, N terminal domain